MIPYGYAQPDVKNIIEQMRIDAIEFNKSVTDQEILKFLEFQYEIDQDMLKQLRDMETNPEKLKLFLTNYRRSHNEAGIKLLTLKGMLEKEKTELKEIFKFKKKEYYESIEADNRLKNVSNEQLKIVFEEGIRLIKNYDSLKKEPMNHDIKITDNFPTKLEFLKLHLIYLTETNCRFYIQKGIGKGIGFLVSNEKEEWKLWTFNDYMSWDRQEVKIQ